MSNFPRPLPLEKRGASVSESRTSSIGSPVIDDVSSHSPEVPLNQFRSESNIRHSVYQNRSTLSIANLDPSDLSKILPRNRVSFSDRSISTSFRLRQQGFRSTKLGNFAVKSIRRGSDEWMVILKPFVADLAFRSVVYKRSHSECSFRPYTCQASVLFVDLSSYSAITRLIAHRGAHTLSTIVNSYFTRLLKIVRKYGGDVCKFAGDAVLCVWEGEGANLDLNNQTAVLCALEMQEKAGSHNVDGTPMSFRIHAGVCCGLLESEVFEAPSNANMQRLFHSVGGESLAQLGVAVNFAKPGEVCITSRVACSLEPNAKTRPLPGREADYAIVDEFEASPDVLEKIETRVDQVWTERLMRRNQTIAEDFIHPSVLKLLGHGGLSPTQIAQMRSLCVLFIAKTSNSSSVNWLNEISSVLDSQRCPIVQIVDDDKGVHVIAAINLYEAVPESSLKGVNICSDLCAKQVGCAIGMACGPTFCGVTGYAAVACRWDITGKAVVRAARLMQFALHENIEVAIDQSIHNSSTAATRLSILKQEVRLKGTETSVPVYTLSQSCQVSAFRVLESVHGRVHQKKVSEIVNHIRNKRRSAVLVTGPQLAGKKIVAQRAAGYTGLVPYLHISDESAGFLQLAKSIATWFRFVGVEVVEALASTVLLHLEKGRWSRAHDDCVGLVDLALKHGLKSCFIIDRIQFLDDFSLSVLRECLQQKKGHRKRSPSLTINISDGTPLIEHSGQGATVCFLCVHGALYRRDSAKDIVEDITRSSADIDIPIIQVCEATADELKTLAVDLMDVDVDDRWLETFNQASGGCVGYCIEKAAALRDVSKVLWEEGKHGYTQLTESLNMTVTPGKIKSIHDFSVYSVNPDVAMKFSQTFDDLPPIMQTLCKVLAVSYQNKFYKLPRFLLWETLNDLVADGVELGRFSVMVEELVELFILKSAAERGQEVLCFQVPAMVDTAVSVCTPIQVRSIAEVLIERLEEHMQNGDFRIPFIIASLTLQLYSGEDKRIEENKDVVLQAWKHGHKVFLLESESWEASARRKWQERFYNEIAESGLDVTYSEVFGENICLSMWGSTPIVPILTLLSVYSAPVCMGPMAQTLMVLSRNLKHTYGKFHGYEQSRVSRIEEDMANAGDRYLQEVDVIEEFVAEHNLAVDPKLRTMETEIIRYISTTSLSEDEVLEKASTFLDKLASECVEDRARRLTQLVGKLRSGEIPEIVQRADIPIQRAYRSFRGTTNRLDSAQTALMILATSNWQPRLTPEFLPITTILTVARIRNRCFKRLTGSELLSCKHEQTHESFEAFLVTTPLLYESFEYREFCMFQMRE